MVVLQNVCGKKHTHYHIICNYEIMYIGKLYKFSSYVKNRYVGYAGVGFIFNILATSVPT